MITIAILNNAFDSKVKLIEDVYTRVKALHYSLEFKWKLDKLKTLIFY